MGIVPILTVRGRDPERRLRGGRRKRRGGVRALNLRRRGRLKGDKGETSPSLFLSAGDAFGRCRMHRVLLLDLIQVPLGRISNGVRPRKGPDGSRGPPFLAGLPPNIPGGEPDTPHFVRDWVVSCGERSRSNGAIAGAKPCQERWPGRRVSLPERWHTNRAIPDEESGTSILTGVT